MNWVTHGDGIHAKLFGPKMGATVAENTNEFRKGRWANCTSRKIAYLELRFVWNQFFLVLITPSFHFFFVGGEGEGPDGSTKVYVLVWFFV